MTPVYKCLPALLLAFQTCLLSAQSISWQPLDGPLGSYQINDMARDGSGNLFIYMNRRIYLSTDQGDSWVERNTGITADQLTSFVRFLEAPNGTLYVHLGDILDGYLYRYDTGLQRWVNIPLPFGNYGPDGLDFDSQGRLWASTNESHSILYVSLNGGQSFEKVTPSISVDGWFDILATHNDEHNLIAVSYGASQKVFHFTRSGVTKQVISGRPVYYLGYNPHTGTAFYSDSDGSKRSANGGLNWQNLLVIPGGSSYQSRITKMFFDPGGRIWAQVGSALYFSDDDGLTWSPEPQMAGLSATFYRTGPATWFAANSCSEPGFSRTTDQGGSWTDLSKKFKQPAVQTILKNGAGDLYAKTCRRGGFERSADEGKTWTDLTIPDGAEMVLAVNVATRPDGLVLAVGANSKLYRSFDNGGSWKILDAIDDQPVAPPARFINFAIDPKGVCYFFNYYYGTWRSYDSGNTWQKINFASAPLTNDVSFHPNGDLYATDGFQAWRYHADGDSVSYLEVPGSQFFDFYSVHCTSTGTVFFTGYDLTQSQVYRIPSGGTVPEVLQTFPQGILPYRFLSNAEGDVFGFTGTGLYVSENNGDSWQNAGPLPAASWSTAYVSPDQYLYTGYNGTVIHRSATPTAESNRVTGRVWLDADGDCSFSAGETALPEVLVQAKGAAGDYRGFSGFDGGYLLTAPSGNFKLQVRPPNALFEPCFDAVPVQLDGPNDTAQADLPLRPAVQCPYLSVDLSAALLRRCFETTYFVSYRNQGTAPAPNAKVTVTLDPLFEFLSASLPVAAQSGLDYTFQLGTLAPGQRGTLALRLRISCDAALGETHCIIARIFPNDLCLPTLEPLDEARECRQNIGSYDPNDKRVFVEGKEEPGFALQDTDLEYLIRFQNTGTDTAFRVVVEDRLAASLDLASLQPLVASHPYTMELHDQRVVRFVFDNILLPDSNINEPASHGFIKFRVAQLPSLPRGTTIRNEADIFFDFNDPVHTNTASVVVGTTYFPPEPGPLDQVVVWPNPFGAELMFEIYGAGFSGPAELRLFDAMGRQRWRGDFAGRLLTMPRQGLEPGVYFYRVESEGKVLGQGRVLAR